MRALIADLILRTAARTSNGGSSQDGKLSTSRELSASDMACPDPSRPHTLSRQQA